MTLQDQLKNDMKDAMRSRDEVRLGVIRMALAALQQAQMTKVKAEFDRVGEAGAAGVDRAMPLSETEMQAVVSKEIKRRRESAELYTKGNRPELAAQEENEATILASYLPKQLSAEELRPLVAAIIGELGVKGPADQSKLMPVLMQRLKDRAEGRTINQVARELLAEVR
jgi:hypothetical protein